MGDYFCFNNIVYANWYIIAYIYITHSHLHPSYALVGARPKGLVLCPHLHNWDRMRISMFFCTFGRKVKKF